MNLPSCPTGIAGLRNIEENWSRANYITEIYAPLYHAYVCYTEICVYYLFTHTLSLSLSLSCALVSDLNWIVSKTEGTCQFAESTNYFVLARVTPELSAREFPDTRLVSTTAEEIYLLKFSNISVCASFVYQMNDQRPRLPFRPRA